MIALGYETWDVKGGTSNIVASLQSEILLLQGYKPAPGHGVDGALGPIANALPSACFPLGTVHEFISSDPNTKASTAGFIAGLISQLLGSNKTGIWISASRTLFPPALKLFGIEPDRFIFVDLKKEIDVLWAVEEALKCAALSAVIGEIPEVSFLASRRFQLAVENSGVTGFIVQPAKKKLQTTAFASRWRISPLPSFTNDLPGLGFPRWKVELLKIKNGRPGVWNIQWVNGKFQSVMERNTDDFRQDVRPYQNKKTG